MSFTCPCCGSHEFGSSNCTGPGPMVRHCHGYAEADGGFRSCDYSFPQSEDADHGLTHIALLDADPPNGSRQDLLDMFTIIDRVEGNCAEPDVLAAAARLKERLAPMRAVLLADAAPDTTLHVCDSCSLGGDTSEKPCEFREDTGIPAPSWLCAECYSTWKEQPE